MSTLSALQILDQLNKFHKTWYELYAIGQHPNVIIFNFLQLINARVLETGGNHTGTTQESPE